MTSLPAVRYVARICPVREVRLSGVAELAYWRQVLRPVELFPYADQGQARLWIGATQSKWKGLELRELTVSLAISLRVDESRFDGFYLAQAFNGSRLLALAESFFFRTPYKWGNIQLAETLFGFEASTPNGLFVSAEIPAAISNNRQASRSAYEDWEGPIFLPSRGEEHPREKFFARLSGQTTVYPFWPERDRFEVGAAAPGVFRQLQESGFRGQEWAIRAEAMHARSNTSPAHETYRE